VTHRNHHTWPQKLAIALVLLGLGIDAWAHAKLVRSNPAARAVVSRAPTQIELWFSEKLERAYSSVELRDGLGAVIHPEKATTAPTNPKQIVVKLPPLPDGQYLVKYRVLSVDGHVVESQFHFTVDTTRR